MGLFKYCLTGIAEFYAKSTPYNSPVLQRAIKYSIPATVYCSLSPGLILTCVMAHWLRVNKAWNRPQSLFGSLQCFFLRPNLPFVSEKWQPRSTVKAGGCEKQTLEKLMGVCWRGKLDFPSSTSSLQISHLTLHCWLEAGDDSIKWGILAGQFLVRAVSFAPSCKNLTNNWLRTDWAVSKKVHLG